jgi:citronellol/citronellal dehydrogenase
MRARDLPPASAPFEGRVFAADLLKGRAALVTGGGTGLGRAVARALAEAGADLLLAARRPEPLEKAAEEIRAETGRRVETLPTNIRDVDAVAALAERARELYGQIDVLVDNAGGQYPQRARDFSPKGWRAVIDTNLNGTWNMTQAFEGGGGAKYQIVAVVGRGMPGLAHTAAARAGVVELSRTLAYEWGPKVRVNCVAPGPIDTQGFDEAYDTDFSKHLASLPIPRFGRPQEVGFAAVFLASPAAAWITGETLYVAGGQHFYGLNQALQDDQLGRGEG